MTAAFAAQLKEKISLHTLHFTLRHPKLDVSNYHIHADKGMNAVNFFIDQLRTLVIHRRTRNDCPDVRLTKLLRNIP